MGCGRPRGCSALKSRWSRLSLCPRLSCECPGKGHRQPSVLCLLYSSLGHICNTVGALLASQLGIQVGKALCGRVGTPLRPAHPLLRPWDSRLPARGAILLSWGAGPGGGRILAAWLKVVWQTQLSWGAVSCCLRFCILGRFSLPVPSSCLSPDPHRRLHGRGRCRALPAHPLSPVPA